MKFYEKNKAMSYVIMITTIISIGLWISLIVIHSVDNQSINIFQNQLFAHSYNLCQANFRHKSYGGVPYNDIASSSMNLGTVTAYGNLIVMNHQIYQNISLIMMYVSGGFQFVILVLSFFLLLKSRVPYKTMWYLTNLNHLKTAIYVLAWFGLVCAVIYFGYILGFYLNLGKTDCTEQDLKLYGNGYFLNMILGGIMLFFYLLNYVLAISIKREPEHLKETLFNKQEEETRVALNNDPVEDVQMQKKIVQDELPHIPKINQPVHIEMIQQPPKGFQTNYVSERAEYPPPPQPREESMNTSNFGPSRFAPPPTHPQPNPQPYFYVPSAHQPLAVSHIQVNVQKSPYKQNASQDKNNINSNFLQSYQSPQKISNHGMPRNQFSSPDKKSRLKIFNRGISGSKQQPIIGSLRDKYSRNY